RGLPASRCGSPESPRPRAAEAASPSAGTRSAGREGGIRRGLVLEARSVRRLPLRFGRVPAALSRGVRSVRTPPAARWSLRPTHLGASELATERWLRDSAGAATLRPPPAEAARGARGILGSQVGRRREDCALHIFRLEAVGVLQRPQQLGGRVQDRLARIRGGGRRAAQSTQSLAHGTRGFVALDGDHGCRASQGARPDRGVPPGAGRRGGPCCATATKPDAGPPLGLEGFAALARLAPAGVPVIAIGGITAANAGALAHAAAAGVAVSAAVWSASEPAAATRALRAAFP